jgi:hypothetical protein
VGEEALKYAAENRGESYHFAERNIEIDLQAKLSRSSCPADD